MLSVSSEPSSATVLARDWAVPRSAAAFTGFAGGDAESKRGGAVLLCVANTPIPCTLEARDRQRVMQFTVLNVREKGWLKAPWKKAPPGKGAASKAPREDTGKDLFEIGEWAKDDVTMERVGKSVLVYSFAKDGQASRGERADDKISHVAAGQTIRVILHDFMYEEKKGGAAAGVFPADRDVIPPFAVLEVMISAGNTKSYDEGFGITVARVRECPFSLYTMLGPLGLALLPSTYEASVAEAEAGVQLSPGLQKILETKNTGFFGRITAGSYVTKYSDDSYRLVGPKEDPTNPMSRHLNVLANDQGGVFAITISKRDLLRFTNAVEPDDEDNALACAQFLVDLAASANALSCYVIHNEYLMRKDPNGIAYAGVPLVDTNKLLEVVTLSELIERQPRARFPLPFPVVNMDAPFVTVDCACVDNNSAGEDAAPLPCPDLVLASENAPVRCAYPLLFGDATDDEFMRLLFVPKAVRPSAAAGAGGGGPLERMDYRLRKKARVAE